MYILIFLKYLVANSSIGKSAILSFTVYWLTFVSYFCVTNIIKKYNRWEFLSIYFIYIATRVRTFGGFIEKDEGNKFRSLLEFEMDEISYADG